MKWFYIIALLLTIALVATPFWLLKAEDTSRYKGKIVQYNIYPSKVNSIDPVTCGDTMSAAIQGNFYEGLYTYHYLKRPMEVIPELADGMPDISDDGLTYTIKIKKGIQYFRNPCFGKESDGRYKNRTVTAHDFVLAFKRVGDYHINTRLSLAFVQDKILGFEEYRRKTRSYAPGDFSRYEKENLPGVVALDEHTLQFKLARHFPQLLYVLAMQSYAPTPREVISYHLASKDDGKGGRIPIPVKERSTEIREPEAVVGTGAFMLTEWVRGSKIVVERHPEFRDVYYPTEGAPGDREMGLLKDAGKKLPFVDIRQMICVTEPNPQWMLFLTKQRDYALIPPQVFQTVISPSHDLLETWKEDGISLRKDPYPAIYWIAFNMEDEVTGTSKALRQGLYLAFDVEEYIKTVWNGRGKRGLNISPAHSRDTKKPAGVHTLMWILRRRRKKSNKPRKNSSPPA